jgi:hypothetical protein
VIRLVNILKEVLHKTQIMKMARDIANSQARRGESPKEAIDFAANSVKLKYGYDLSDEDKKSLEHWVFVHPNFR